MPQASKKNNQTSAKNKNIAEGSGVEKQAKPIENSSNPPDQDEEEPSEVRTTVKFLVIKFEHGPSFGLRLAIFEIILWF